MRFTGLERPGGPRGGSLISPELSCSQEAMLSALISSWTHPWKLLPLKNEEDGEADASVSAEIDAASERAMGSSAGQ